jgi:hypothetical protein
MEAALAPVRHQSSSALRSSRARLLLGSAVFSAYVVIGSSLMVGTLAPEGRADDRLERPEPVETLAGLSSRPVEIELAVVDGPTLRCWTARDHVAADTLAVPAAEAPRLMGELGCSPADAVGPALP